MAFRGDKEFMQITGRGGLEKAQTLLKSVTSDFMIQLTSDIKARKERKVGILMPVFASNCAMGRACHRGSVYVS